MNAQDKATARKLTRAIASQDLVAVLLRECAARVKDDPTWRAWFEPLYDTALDLAESALELAQAIRPDDEEPEA